MLFLLFFKKKIKLWYFVHHGCFGIHFDFTKYCVVILFIWTTEFVVFPSPPLDFAPAPDTLWNSFYLQITFRKLTGSPQGGVHLSVRDVSRWSQAGEGTQQVCFV